MPEGPTRTTHTDAAGDAIDELLGWYDTYADDLRRVREEQREHRAARPTMRAQLDDLEAELTYLRIRNARPAHVVEIGCLHGWSTSWLLRALRDNDHGRLHSFDRVDAATRAVPKELTCDRWSFVHGDMREGLDRLPANIGYLFIDAAHTARFAKWYLASVLPRVVPGTPVSVHDVFHLRRPLPFTEGSVLLKWLRANDIDYFTVARRAAPEAHRRLVAKRRELGIDAPVHDGDHNPMLFFTR
ncbi:MAG TPA: class I SAM-dependent methyltransferase [Stackebrandtia sp.]|jgi:predicted O-methyltransferase YrrM|uniref:class I SAM-dependent methyltransferase n=1 Tax=Stackebrandtia sp. TaxID=2023065 RepID=UPI002D2B5D51|nr:class I SAM-dependent methyltransferase [Stackebrandtia sp.]HZE37491.1 class I SAM-dependent methyltransferase [Stackebrandtia sp.]